MFKGNSSDKSLAYLHVQCILTLKALIQKMHILLTVLHTFIMELVRRIFLEISRHLILGDHFLYSCHLHV